MVPEEGALIWTDNMLIPKGAVNKYTAELMMNYVYDPKVGPRSPTTSTTCPGEARREEIKALDPEAATNPLLFPDAETAATFHSFQALSEEQGP